MMCACFLCNLHKIEVIKVEETVKQFHMSCSSEYILRPTAQLCTEIMAAHDISKLLK